MRRTLLGLWSIYLGTEPKYRLCVGNTEVALDVFRGVHWAFHAKFKLRFIISSCHGQDVQHFPVYTKPQEDFFFFKR